MDKDLNFSKRATSASEVLDLLKNPFQAQLAQTSVIASFGTSLGFTALLAIGFSLLRPYNSVVYAPKLKVADDKHAPPPLGRGIFSWLKPLAETSEQKLEDLIGIDAVVFLRILAMCRNIFVSIALVGCLILIPVNFFNGTHKNIRFIIKVTPINTFGHANWAMAFCAWIFNFIIAGFLWWNYRAILKLRRKYYDSSEYQTSLHARTLMLNNIPREYCSDEGINTLIDKVAPMSSFSRTAIARNCKELPELIKDHTATVKELEKYLAKYLKNTNNLPLYRPKCYPSKKDPARDTYPKGQKLDAIEYLSSRIKDLEVKIREVRTTLDHRNPLPYGFASYDSIEECHAIAFATKSKQPHGTTIVLAPKPNDIIWKNMALTKAQRRTRKIVNNMWVGFLTILWVVPNALTSLFLMSLGNLGHVWQAFHHSLSTHTTWWSFIQGVASPAITSLVYIVLPIIFRRLAIQAGDRTRTARERHVTSKLYTFFVFNFLIVFSMFSTVWNFVSTVINAKNSGTDAWKAIFDADFSLATFISLCDVSPFWITWLLQQNLGAAIDFSQLWKLIWCSCVRRFSSPTPREMIELTAPQAFDYASYYNYFLFYSTVALCFAALQPLVLPACALYFTLDYYFKKYLLLYIFVTKIESGGMFWRTFFNRMVFAAILSNLVVFLALWVHGDSEHTFAYTILPLPLMMLGFKFYCKRNFDDKIHYYNRRNLLKESELSGFGKFDSRKDRLVTRFGNPAFYRPLITPMVHAKAQNMLASIFNGWLPNSNLSASSDANLISNYSDTYVLHNIQQDISDHRSGVPGFEIVPENRLDFSFYRNRYEFADKYACSSRVFRELEDENSRDQLSLFGSDSKHITPILQRNITSPKTSFEGTLVDRSKSRDSSVGKIDDKKILVRGLIEPPSSLPITTSNTRDLSRHPGSSEYQGKVNQDYIELSQEVQQDSENYDRFRRGMYGLYHKI